MSETLSLEEMRTHRHSRHAGLLSRESQDKIADTKLLIAGCGVGSLIAISAARMGFEHFVLVDGDSVEASNLNRQGYAAGDIGMPKAEALAGRIKHVNPHAVTKHHNVFVTPENVERFVSEADLVIDAIDPEATVVEIALHREARKQGKLVIQPSDLGWGALVHIFGPHTIGYEEVLGYTKETPLETIDPQEAVGRVIEHYVQVMPEYVRQVTMEFMAGKIDHFPQLVSAAYIAAAMTVVAAKRITLGLPVKMAPEYIAFDPNEMLTPALA